MLFHRHIVVLHVREPIHHIASAIKARAAWRFAYGEHHLAAGQMQVLGNLRTGLPRAHHQYRPFWQRLRIAILRRLQLHDLRWQSLCHAWHDRRVVSARCHHHVVSREITLRGGHRIGTVLLALHAADLGVLEQRRIDHRNEPIEVSDDLVLFHEAVRIVAGIRVARQCALPVRRDETERIPTLLAPGVRDGLLFEHKVIEACLLQVIADRQTRLPAADDEHAVMAIAAWAGAHGMRCVRHDASLQVITFRPAR